MLTLDQLELEVLSSILEFVDDASPRTTKAVACVSSYLNEVTRSIAHRHKTIFINGAVDDKTIKTLQSWTEDSVVLANIRTFTVKGYLSVGVSEQAEDETEDDESDDQVTPAHTGSRSERTADTSVNTWLPITLLLSKIGKLRHLEWNVNHALPFDVLVALETYQRAATLKIFNFTRAVTDPPSSQLDPIESKLAVSPALTHLRMVTQLVVSHQLQELAFRSIISSAPNLEYAGLINPYYRPGDSVPTPDLRLIEPSSLTQKKPNTSIKHLTLDGYDVSKQTLDYWSSIIDLSSLNTVKFSRGTYATDYFQHAATMLPNLKEISLNLSNVIRRPQNEERSTLISSVQHYLSACSPLKMLSLWSWRDVVSLPDLLSRHGPSLETLQLHEREVYDPRVRKSFSLDDIKSIRASCPRLKDLTIDMNRTSAKLDWQNDSNRAYYDELAQIKNLQALQIYFDCGWAHNSALQGYPLPPNQDLPIAPSPADVIPAYVQNIWTTVFPPGRGGPRHLDVKFGEFESAPSFLFSTVPRHYIVRPHERDDVMEPWIKVIVKGER